MNHELLAYSQIHPSTFNIFNFLPKVQSLLGQL
jgi:hypothetical protein